MKGKTHGRAVELELASQPPAPTRSKRVRHLAAPHPPEAIARHTASSVRCRSNRCTYRRSVIVLDSCPMDGASTVELIPRGPSEKRVRTGEWKSGAGSFGTGLLLSADAHDAAGSTVCVTRSWVREESADCWGRR